MKYLTVDQIREKFLDFFIAKNHLVVPSFPVVPQNDNSLLLIAAGMAPLKPYFTGQQTPPSLRMATCQKCIRTTDIEEVGKDDRHNSFFEMLGNFSFGDYFKKECIPWAWEFVTQVMEIPADKLWISVYEEDDEAAEIWQKDVGIPAQRIVRLGKKDNFWEHGAGPCGPCSEIHFDRGAEVGCGKPDCAVGCECDRYLEFWNLVFTQFNCNADGSYTPLEMKNIDTGMGLSRMAMIMQNVYSVHEIDDAARIREKVRTLAGITSTETAEQKVAINIIADHIRCVTIMASDGVRPGSEGRDYVLRRLLRRAVRYGRNIGLKQFAGEVVQTVIEVCGKAYPNLVEKSVNILQTLTAEEARFLETLETGLTLLQKYVDELKTAGKKELNGEDAFKLYDTFGFPPDITREILEESGLTFDQAGFDAQMQAQKDRARAARGTSTFMGADETVYHQLPPNLPTEFIGYEHVTGEGKILAIVANGAVAQEATAGQEVALVLDRTPFYAASGGQKGDIGVLTIGDKNAPTCEIEITDCLTVAGENRVHIGKIKNGSVKINDIVTASIDAWQRHFTSRNHTATHILQRVLKEILGDHVEQAGSEVTPDRLRFDFTHHAPLTAEERANVEDVINALLIAQHPVTTIETTLEDARKQGALALFGEKYGDTVRMVKINDLTLDYSIELCGGTHVSNTVEIGTFKLLSENGIAAGVRRIEATTGKRAIEMYRDAAAHMTEIADLLKAPQHEIPAKIAALLAENKELKKAADRQKAEAAKGQIEEIAKDILESASKHGEFTLITAKLDNYDIEALRQLSDKLKANFNSGALLLAATNEGGAVQFLASATDCAVKTGIHAGNIVKAAATLCGGNGGGRPNHAQAGGKDASQVDAALSQGLAQMKEMLGE
ncbi:MAG: alanine--tRNA ligase [Defluviitaleaceae bacterium]|nr:alanine--tRNA ligase [Defluviitaleaceae bacterium]MCL2275503.1 alanine--tRNA ligase [Defluviitaleaceae bacterium]